MRRDGERRFQCLTCKRWGDTSELREQLDYAYANLGDTAEMDVKTNRRIRTADDLVKLLDLDTKVWEIDHFTVSKSEGYRKERSVKWKVKNSRVIEGEVNDTGDLLIKPMFAVKVWIRRKTREIRITLATDQLKRDMMKFAPRYKTIHYLKLRDALMLEVEMPDLHLGKVAFAEETGEEMNVQLQMQRARDTLKFLLSLAQSFPIERILFPLGNDYFNSDNQWGTTTAGTAQREDHLWSKVFHAGRVLAVEMIDMCTPIAPVDVLLVPGNHDEERNFYLGDALEVWYRNNHNVTIDNRRFKRKYYSYGINLIGFTHGSNEKRDRLPSIMPIEAPQLWAQSRVREWHTGDKHHKADLLFRTLEDQGVVVRIMRSLTALDRWHYDHAFVGALAATEAFLWDKARGVIAQFTSPALGPLEVKS